MKTLIIYDLNGTIIGSPITGVYQVPNGLPYLEVVIPEKKYVVSVNVETKQPIYEDVPQTQVEILENKVSMLSEKNSKLEKEHADLLFMLMENNVL